MARVERRGQQPGALDWPWPQDTHPVLRQVLARRPLQSLDDLDLELKNLTPVGTFHDLAAAVELLLAHRESNIVVVGDFDSDGATSSALMLRTLADLGFGQVSAFVPDRFELGYGLTPEVVERIASRAPSLIVTVDNGISSIEGVAAARAAGIDVLVTDHHLPPETLPDANAIVNPNVLSCAFAGKHLAGVGVVFYLLAALGQTLGQPGAVARYLDLVAVGTVADLVVLDRLNRVLVEQGLRRIRAGQCVPGIRALATVAGVDLSQITTGTLGFQIAPRLNAAGRLEDMTIGVRCLTTPSEKEALELAGRLDGLNRQRRELEGRMREDALAIVEELDIESDHHVVCLYRDDWHEGIVGLVASKIKERCYRPTFAFAPTQSGELKGSGRSIPGFHLRDALADVDAAHPGLIGKFGGHAMAAGLTLAADSLDAFERAIDAAGAKRMNAEQLSERIYTDGELASEHLSLEVAQLLKHAAPWGQGFPEPSFDGVFELVEHRWLKDVHLKMKLRPASADVLIEAIAFNCAPTDVAQAGRVHVVYRLSVNDYRSPATAQLIVEQLEPV